MQAFGTSVNSPLKPPIQNATKDNTQNNGSVGRRTSVSQLQAGANAYSGASPSTRLGMRRRDTSESLQLSANSLASPNIFQKTSKEESDISTPPPSLPRRRTDLKDGLEENVSDKDKESRLSDGAEYSSPFGALKRTATGPVSVGQPGASSPWSAAPQSAGYAPMGAFGNFSLGGVSAQPLTPGEKKGAFGSLRGESRFKGLMGPVNSDDADPSLKLKASLSSLDKISDLSNDLRSQTWSTNRSTRPLSTELNSFGEDQRTGSAALGGDDVSPPYQRMSTLKYPNRQTSFDDIGFSTIAPSEIPPFRDTIQRREFPQQHTPQHRYQAMPRSNEPMSPTYTNPYHSPEGERAVLEDLGANESDMDNAHIPAVAPFGHPPRAIHPQLENATGGRSETSSAGPGRKLPLIGNLGPFGNLGTSGPWSAASGAIGTPTKTHPVHSGDSIFGPLGELQSPGQAAFNSAGFFGGPSVATNANSGTTGRGSKMGSLFPAAMQEQMRGDSLRQESEGFQQMNPSKTPSGTNAPGFGDVARDTDSSTRQGRGMLDDLFGNLDLRARGAQAVSSPFATSEASDPTFGQALSGPPQSSFSASSTLLGTPAFASTASGSYLSRSQDQENIAAISSQIPATQQRQMVMPDRMRWIYRDPQGNTQGPWSGLEMHDWYKAGFFSPELQVKKLEDADYEPLAQLIRRIGNSREPFLVPQIGIPHGSSAQGSSIAPAAGNITATAPSAAQIGSAQPPFASSFPSFGTTLTAEQQNALERRKQEEQYLMARQKEHLAQQQVLIKQMQHMQSSGHLHGQQLHHHSSAHSLQSQPSYGSITSPTGYQPSPAQGPIQPSGGVPGFYEAPRNFPSNQGPLGPSHDPLGSVREEDIPSFIEKFNNARTMQQQYSSSQSQYLPNQQEGMIQQQQITVMLQDRARLQREQEQYDMMQRKLPEDPTQSADRLAQYRQLRAQVDQQHAYTQSGINDGSATQPLFDHDLLLQEQGQNDRSMFEQQPQAVAPPHLKPEPPSLSEQVQRAAALAQQEAQPHSPWAKADTGLPQPFPPPQSSSPLPAPAARRNRQNVADALAAESRSETQTPSVETPSAAIAPWAKDNNEASKGPSLKEIQETEVRKAAQQEEIAIASRKAAAEQERLNQVAPITSVAGLPSSSKWASSASPAIPTSTGPSPWANPKPVVVTPVVAAKKTLAQIQKEEEARKQRAVASAAATAVSSALNAGSLAGGKRYADLAGKVTLAGPTAPGGAWTTVGSSGKVKTPSTPIIATAVRTSSGGAVAVAPVAVKPIQSPAISKSTGSSVPIASQQNAHAELKKWAKGALSKGLNSNINGRIPLQLFLFPCFAFLPFVYAQVTFQLTNRSRRFCLSTPHAPPRTRHPLRSRTQQ